MTLWLCRLKHSSTPMRECEEPLGCTMLDQAKQRVAKNVLARWERTVFLAGLDSSGTRLTFHVSTRADVAPLQELARSVVRESGLELEVRVRCHSLKRLAYPKSVARFIDTLDVAYELHDPTFIHNRGLKLLRLAERSRERHSRAIRGLYFDPDERVLFVWSPASKVLALRGSVAALAEEIDAEGVVKDQPELSRALPFSVRVVNRLPARKLIPIDERSSSLSLSISRIVRRWMGPSAVAAAAATVAIPAFAFSSTPVKISQTVETPKAKSSDKYGILFGLTVFADGLGHGGFSALGLDRYFSDRQLAAAGNTAGPKNTQNPNEQGQVQGQAGVGS